MRSSKQVVSTLEVNIRFRGAMSKLISDYAEVEISNKVKDILRMYHSSSWHSEPYHQNQNPSEWHYRTIKSWTNTILNRTGAPANCWLLCMSYACCILKHISSQSLNGQIQLTKIQSVPPYIGSFPELCIYFAFGRISFHLHYICTSFAFRIAPRISIFALHFISISKCQINVKC